MERRLEFMDVIVAVGLAATIVASGLLLMAANGMQISILGRESANNHTETDFLQPVLGQAIVDHVLLEHRHTREAAAAMTQLNRLVVEHNQWQHSAYGYLAPIANGASWAEAEHASRVQAVMGRSIVNFTRRGVRSGLWSLADRFAPGNPRMIRVTEARGETMHRALSRIGSRILVGKSLVRHKMTKSARRRGKSSWERQSSKWPPSKKRINRRGRQSRNSLEAQR
jgi:hypothetical protein